MLQVGEYPLPSLRNIVGKGNLHSGAYGMIRFLFTVHQVASRIAVSPPYTVQFKLKLKLEKLVHRGWTDHPA
ncbi:hypothetical protein SAMN05444955_102231 [Lihuaxuella thermophila]|uniref:Uncharacterized protein n=1 Tax=Lihuaxuella thermophila TaxID=1173111 RepID=A0A1H8BMY8_9BACL|nr:hypothetical protein SAMN05444955_102231 [Lihuaxuella thermophila]